MDNKIRVVLAYGALLYKQNNESNIVRVEALLKEILIKQIVTKNYILEYKMY